MSTIFSFNIAGSYTFSINNFVRVEVQETPHILHGWHELLWRILIFFVTEPNLDGQLKLICMIHESNRLALIAEDSRSFRACYVQGKARATAIFHTDSFQITTTVLKLDVDIHCIANGRWKVGSCQRKQRNWTRCPFFFNYLMAWWTNRLGFLSLMLRF